MRQKIASITQMLRLPSVCVLCQRYHRQSVAVCDACSSLLEPLGPTCHYCALPLPDDKFLICGVCSLEKPIVDKTIITHLFEEPLRTLLHEFKYQESLYLGGFLAKLMLDALPGQTIDSQCLVPVPLHPTRMRQRGFNHAAELAKCLAKKLKIPCEFDLCKKIIHTSPQAYLNKKQRKRNLSGVFLSKVTKYTHITLVDDLLTTGSTANELARAFKQQGVTRVDLWCCARAI